MRKKVLLRPLKIMQTLSFLPDKIVIKIQYRIKTGRKLDLRNPKRYTEKIQWYKLNYKNPVLKTCVDKYEVRAFVTNQGCQEILNDCYGVFDSAEGIDITQFLGVFVCKDTLGGGSTSVEVFDKENGNYKELKRKMNKWLHEPSNKKSPGREWPYDNQKHRVIIGRFLEQSNGDLADYKFFCFDGKVKCFYVRTDYNKNHENGKMPFFDCNLNLIEGVYMDYCKPSFEVPPLPKEISQMIEYAEVLATGFPHVRVDLYDVDGKIQFGELTFFNASGYMSFIPDEFDFIMGAYFKLTSVIEGGDKVVVIVLYSSHCAVQHDRRCAA